MNAECCGGKCEGCNQCAPGSCTGARESLPPYVPNQHFVPGKSQVLYSGPYWDQQEINAAIKALTSGRWLSAGAEVERFQRQFSRQFKVGYSHMVNSGSSANLVMIAALKRHYGWQDGDEVIVSPVGFPTTVAPLVQNGLCPVFADIEMDTLNFDLGLVEQAITERTRAIFVSPVLGNPPDMDQLRWIVSNILPAPVIIGDNCDSLGTLWRQEYLTHHYAAWSTSFYPAHHITTGEGGMVSSNGEELMKLVRSFSWWGRGCYCVGQANLLPCGTCKQRFSKWIGDVDEVIDHKYLFEHMGYNLKPLDLQGAIGQVQLRKFADIEQKRRFNAEAVRAMVERMTGVRSAKVLPEADPSWFGVPVICDTPAIKRSLVAHLEAHKVQTRSYFAGNLLRHPGYRHLGNAAEFPNADKALSHVFFLGCPPHHTPEILCYVQSVLESWQP